MKANGIWQGEGLLIGDNPEHFIPAHCTIRLTSQPPMDKNQIIGIVLMVLLYIGYIWYTTPTEEDRLAAIAAQEQQVEQARLDSIAAVEEAEFQPNCASNPGIGHHQHRGARCLARSTVWRIGSAALGEDQTYTLASEGVTATFSSRGGLLSEPN